MDIFSNVTSVLRAFGIVVVDAATTKVIARMAKIKFFMIFYMKII